MTKQEVIENFYTEIVDGLRDCTRDSMMSHGKVKYIVCCDENDGVKIIESAPGEDVRAACGEGLHLITVVDVGVGFDPKEELLANYDNEVDEAYDMRLGYMDDAELVDIILDGIDWNEMMEQIEADIFYEEV